MNQKEIKWLPLRLNIIPLLDKQAKAVLELYLAVRKEIMEGDILAIQRLTAIKEQIQGRIKEIDAFYTKNSMDPRTKYIYTIRAILTKIVEQRNNFEQISFNSGDNTWIAETPARENIEGNFGISPNATQRKPTTQKSSKNVTSRNPLQHDRHPHFSDFSAREPEVMRLSDLKKIHRNSKSPMMMNRQENKQGTFRKTEQGATKRSGKQIEQVMALQRQKAEANERLQRNNFDINKSFKDLSELVFTIKMTKEEYNEFMRLKRKNNHA